MFLDYSRVAAAAILSLGAIGCGGGEPDHHELLPDSGGGDPVDAPSSSGDAAIDPDAGMEPEADADPADMVSIAELYVASTHNSYSGDGRGSITAQLDSGVRMIELDIHDNDFASEGYRIGHDEPGHQVAYGRGNPDSDALIDWLDYIATWSTDHPGHVPITLLLDFKDTLDDNESYAAGDLTNLHAVIAEALGPRLYRATDAQTALPTVADTRGRILVVLSGDEETRLAYRRDRGKEPAVALDASGHVIEVHAGQGDDDLWYWTGEVTANGVRWLRHTRYDTGVDPAVAINNDGLVVEVHEDPDAGDDTLWYRVGQLGADFEVTWYHDGGIEFPGSDTGVNPTVRFTDRDGLTVREVHQSPNDGEHWYWDGTFNPSTMRIEWSRGSDGGQTDEPLFDAARDEVAGMVVAVSTGSVGPYGADTLRYHLSDSDWSPIRYEQILFVEIQEGGNGALADDDLWFVAAAAESSSGRTFVQQARAAGRLGRLWQFASTDQSTDPPANFPATDTPDAPWYLDYCMTIGCRQ